MRGGRAVRRGRHDLSDGFRTHVAHGKNSCKLGFRAFVGDDIALFIQVYLPRKQFGIRFAADCHKQSLTLDRPFLARIDVGKPYARHLFLVQNFLHATVPDHLNAALFQGLGIDLRCAERIAAVNQIYLFTYLCEIERVGNRAVSAARHDDGLSLITHTVAGCAIRHAAPYKFLFFL